MEWWRAIIGSGEAGIKELTDVGYPESVAKRIESGELPMDYESRMARAKEQGYDIDTTYYHTGSPDISEINTDAIIANKPFWMTDSPEMSASYYKPDFQTYPMLVNKSRMGDMYAEGRSWDRLDNAKYISSTGDEVIGEIYDTNRVANKSNRIGDSGVVIRDVRDIGGNPNMMSTVAKSLNGDIKTREYFNNFAGADVVAANDPNVVKSKLSAAFDPEYDGPNIMGLNSGKAGPDLAGKALDAAKGQSKGFLESVLGSLQSDQPQQVLDDTYYGDDSMGESKGVDYTKQFEAIADMPEEIWDGMKTREKVALITSMIPVVGTGTGVYADVMNMVEDPDERTLVNTILLASNFIPANQVAKMADRMGITDLYKKTDLGAPRTKEEVEAAKVSGFGDVVQTQKAGEVTEAPLIEELTATGKVSNPLLSELREGKYGNRVSPQQKTKLEGFAAENPVFEQQQLLRSGGSRTVSEHDLYSQQANWEQMIGNPLVILPADMTSIQRVERIGGVNVEPFHTQGGGMHSDYTGIWRSMDDAAAGKQRHINRVREETGKDPIMIYTPMQHAGSNFSTMGSEGILHYLDAVGDLTPEGRKQLDAYMKGLNQNTQDWKGIPDAYEGYENPEQMLWWLTSPDAVKKGDPSLGNRRKAFMQAMSVKEMQQHGAPDINDVYTAINEASMHNLPHGMSGGKALISADVDPKAMNKSNLHGSYNTDIESQGALTLQDDSGAGLYVPTFTVFPDMAARRADKAPAQRYRSMQTAGSKIDYQMADEEWYEGINKYYNSLRGE